MAETFMSCYLPLDLIVDEILSRSSEETVATTYVLCKKFNENTYTSRFLQRRRTVGESVPGFVVQNEYDLNYRHQFVSGFGEGSEKEMSLSFLPDEGETEVIAVASNHDLILCVWKRQRSVVYIVSKPATRQWRIIPRPRTRFPSCKYAIFVTTSSSAIEFRYKILRFSGHPKPNDVGFESVPCEILDSATWAWITLPELLELSQYEYFELNNIAVSASGFAYSLTSKKHVVAFDWEAHTWNFIDLPRSTGKEHRIVAWEGKLGLTFLRDHLNTMVLWTYACGVWTMKSRTSLEFLDYWHSVPLNMLCNDVAIVGGFDDMVFLKINLTSPSSDLHNGCVLKVKNRVHLMYGPCFRIESDKVVVNLKNHLVVNYDN